MHVIDQSGERVAQGDTGVGPGAIVPLRSEIDVSTLPPGDYEAARRALRLADRRAPHAPTTSVTGRELATSTRCIVSGSVEAFRAGPVTRQGLHMSPVLYCPPT